MVSSDTSQRIRGSRRPISRRNLIRGIAAGTAFSLIPGSAWANGKGNGGKGGNGGGHDDLVNAEFTDHGAIIATDDDFVISGQEVVVDGSRGSPIISNQGYSGEIYDNTLTVESIDGTTFGVRVDGGDVDVYNNTVEAADSLGGQFIAIGFVGGATGKASRNEITGKHRVGILADDPNTDVNILRNFIEGPGPTTAGWADNGIQISRGATATVRRNTVAEHWWDNDDWESSGIIVFGSSNTTIQRNTLMNNDAGVALFGGFGEEAGDENNIIHNTIEVTRESEVYHEGVFVMGQNNGVRQNAITAENGDVGIFVQGSAENTKLIKNSISGWETAIADGGEDTKLPKPFEPDN